MTSPTAITRSQIAEYLNEELTWTYNLGAKSARVAMKVSPIEVDGDIVTALVDETGKMEEFKIDKLTDISLNPKDCLGLGHTFKLPSVLGYLSFCPSESILRTC